jgi:adenine-specific DNA-methyltransferase
MGKEYETSSNYDDFEEFHRTFLPEIIRITKDGGNICWQVGYHVKNSGVMPLDYLVHQILQPHKEITLRNRLIWTFGHGLHCKKRFSGRHETVLWYSKGNEYTFNLDPVRIAQKYPGKTYYKGAKRGKPSGNPNGKNPADVWEIPNVKANHIEKTTHPCQFPFALAQRLILALSNKNGVVFDPFMGSGTTACAALVENRKFMGTEISPKYYQLAVDRCKQANARTLRFRPHDKPLLPPDPKSKVATNPFT